MKSVDKKIRNILIVEDDHTSMMYFEEVTRLIEVPNTNIILHKARTGEQAVEYCRQHQVDLVLMDIKLPGMDGLEATGLIKKEHPEIVVIAQSGYALSNDHKKSFHAGCDDYLTKPVIDKKLEEKLNLYL